MANCSPMPRLRSISVSCVLRVIMVGTGLEIRFAADSALATISELERDASWRVTALAPSSQHGAKEQHQSPVIPKRKEVGGGKQPKASTRPGQVALSNSWPRCRRSQSTPAPPNTAGLSRPNRAGAQQHPPCRPPPPLLPPSPTLPTTAEPPPTHQCRRSRAAALRTRSNRTQASEQRSEAEADGLHPFFIFPRNGHAFWTVWPSSAQRVWQQQHAAHPRPRAAS